MCELCEDTYVITPHAVTMGGASAVAMDGSMFLFGGRQQEGDNCDSHCDVVEIDGAHRAPKPVTARDGFR